MDRIRIGLDFGTHQTKVCVQTTPDEGHGEPRYEFFKFPDLQGNMQYFLPSVIQINKDDTLSYGYVDQDRMKEEAEAPVKEEAQLEAEFDVEDMTEELFDKYATVDNSSDDKNFLKEMLNIRLQRIKARNKVSLRDAEKIYEAQLKAQQESKNVFRYFKQATFIGGEWNWVTPISNRVLCIWYLAYIIFILEDKYGTNFSINMGVPADDSQYSVKRRLGVELLASAYYLVEDVYHNVFRDFLNEKVEDLLKKTDKKVYSADLKDEYKMNIFPEAYANLTSLTSRGKIPDGMSLTADIGGGTTDISFFTIEEGLPMIYKYWSIPKGLNYVAKYSGFDYADGDFVKRAKQSAIITFNSEKSRLISDLVSDLSRKIREETSIPVQNLRDALEDGILIYSGGGSTFDFLTEEIEPFTDVRVIDPSIWNEENVLDRSNVSLLSQLLTTSYGLSVCENDEDVKMKNYSTLFAHLPKKHENERPEISKDQV